MQVFDFRNAEDIRNLFTTPEIRARFLQFAPHQVAPMHSHDLGHEIFLILEGQAEFQIAGDTRVLGPGELCIARADEVHQVRNMLGTPMTMYLSVTPHIAPTHTNLAEDGSPLPPHFPDNAGYDDASTAGVPAAQLLEAHAAAADALAEAAANSARVQREMAQQVRGASDDAGAEAARLQMWQALYPLFQRVYEQADAWNQLAPRVAEAHGAAGAGAGNGASR